MARSYRDHGGYGSPAWYAYFLALAKRIRKTATPEEG